MPMTREDAKTIFLNRGYINGIYNGDKWRESVVAISKWLEQEPCEDTISRQEAINKMQELENEDIKAYGCKIPEGFDGERAIEALKTLQPVTPKPNDKALKIISETMMDMINNKPFEEVIGNLENNMREMGIEGIDFKENYCPNCGAKMLPTDAEAIMEESEE